MALPPAASPPPSPPSPPSATSPPAAAVGAGRFLWPAANPAPKRGKRSEHAKAKAKAQGGGGGERAYLGLVARALRRSALADRTGVGMHAEFGALLRFSLRGGAFPLLTTKRVAWKSVVLELLWMLGGGTSSAALSASGSKIWDGNGSRAFLDALGFTKREEGDLGPVYGFQWRHWGPVRGRQDRLQGPGLDQIAQIVAQIKRVAKNPGDPAARRICLSAWNVADLQQMALPPCHCFAQFSVRDGELSCMLTQRSADLGLGVPFNIASYSLLTVLLAKHCGLEPGEFVHSLGDYHVYTSHVAGLRQQLRRAPKPFPTIAVSNRAVADLADYAPDDIRLEGYDPHPASPFPSPSPPTQPHPSFPRGGETVFGFLQ